jgi:Family of unknown function (DUF6812)
MMEARETSIGRTERVLFETDRHVIVGDMTLPPEGYQARLSDSMNRSDVSFVPLIDVEIHPIGGGDTERLNFVVISKAHIRMAQPIEDDV